MRKTPVNKILDCSLVDEPGNRTAVFFQRCNLACGYCHNPETQRLCSHCKSCVVSCPAGALKVLDNIVVWDSSVCIGCDACIRVCPDFSSPKVSEMTSDEVFSVIYANMPFIRGITVSGGESTLYLTFVKELFELCKNAGLTCLIDCNGLIPLWNNPVMEVCDGVLLDVKAWSEACFFSLTGSDNGALKENLVHLAQMDKLEELRIVCIEGRVDTPDIICGIAGCVPHFIKEKTLLKLIRFRNQGVKGDCIHERTPSKAYMEEMKEIAKIKGFKNCKIV